MTNKLDPKYGHIVGTCQCKVPDCKGHRKNYQPGLHKICHDHNMVTTKNKEGDIKIKKKRTYHFHQGRRGRCNCNKPPKEGK